MAQYLLGELTLAYQFNCSASLNTPKTRYSLFPRLKSFQDLGLISFIKIPFIETPFSWGVHSDVWGSRGT